MFRKNKKENKSNRSLASKPESAVERPHVMITDLTEGSATTPKTTTTTKGSPSTRSATAPPKRSATTPSKRVSQAHSSSTEKQKPAVVSPKPAVASPPKKTKSTATPPTDNKPPVDKPPPTSVVVVSHPTSPPPSQPPPPPPPLDNTINQNNNHHHHSSSSSEQVLLELLLGQAPMGDVTSQFWLAQLYQYGTLSMANLDRAMAWMQKNNNNNADANTSSTRILPNYQLGLAWEYGTSHEATDALPQAMECYQKALTAATEATASDNNSNNNQMNLVFLIQDALQRVEAKWQAFQLQHLHELADVHGQAAAQYQLGCHYFDTADSSSNLDDNNDPKKNPKKMAVEYWELAANQDHGLAQCRLGECYQEGVMLVRNHPTTNDNDTIIVPQSLPEALIMYEWAVEDDCLPAHFQLGWFYEQGGAGVGPGDYPAALELYDRAWVLAQKQQKQTQQRQEQTQEASQQEGEDDYSETVEKYVQALLRIGAIYEEGITFEPDDDDDESEGSRIRLEPDLDQAILLYQKAADNAPQEKDENDPNQDDADDDHHHQVTGARDFYIQALVRIGSFYENGTGQGGVSEPNFHKALEFYHQAAATTMTESMVTTITTTTHQEEKVETTEDNTMDQYMRAIVRIGTSFYEAHATLIDHHFVMVLGLFEQAEAAAASAETAAEDYEDHKSRHVHVIYEIGCFYEEQGQPTKEDNNADPDQAMIPNEKMKKALELYEQAGQLGSNEARSAMKRIKMQRRKQELLWKRRNKGKPEPVEAEEVSPPTETTKADDDNDESAGEPNQDDKDTVPTGEPNKDEKDTDPITDGNDIDENPIYPDAPTENKEVVEDAGGDIDAVEQQ
eukprot:CAMPEP_0172448560 /NCGR_PEP_ID=MMETSP1065-20121228/7555_1 /TAXON_ID=265537 /ORGANISM="Amphiprora paludosa, Strain CCMP125" /LENGTH=845 /DNA_ID=CAMNT_0013200105 /DNA_START=59 /DNA_END=2596 /DNA_ORIENTATION=-